MKSQVKLSKNFFHNFERIKIRLPTGRFLNYQKILNGYLLIQK